jgi:hypothetical protein
MAYTTSEARQELLDTLAAAADDLGFASACLAEAYEQLDEYNGDRLEDQAFRPVQMAYGRAKRTHTEFAGRYGLEPASFEQQAAGVPSLGAPSLSSVRSRRPVRPTARSRQYRTRCSRSRPGTRSCVPGSWRFGSR